MLAPTEKEIRFTMFPRKFFLPVAASILALSVVGSVSAVTQKKSKKQREQPTTGAVTGRVRVESGKNAGGISVHLRRGDEEVAQTTTNAKGEFEFRGVEPGTYGLTFRKPGLQFGHMDNLEVRAGQTVSLKDHLYLPVDEGSIAFIKGSVFDAGGRSFPGARVELARVEPDGSVKKLGDQISNVTGSFVFRLPPEGARYRVTAKADGMETATQEVTVEGAAIYRTALSLKRASK
jgi:hypothetical protein